jgi:hypothetical protein
MRQNFAVPTAAGSKSDSYRQPRNRALTHIVGAGDAAPRLASVETLAGLFLLMWREDRLTAELDAVGLGVGPAARRAFENAAALQPRRHAEDRKDDLGKIGRGVEERLGQRTDTGSGALHVAGDNQKVGCIAGEAVNGRGDNDIAGRKGLRQAWQAAAGGP